ERACRYLLGNERARFLPQLVALRRQPDLVEAKACGVEGHLRSISSRGKERPELVGPARGNPVAERRCPIALISEIVPPRKQSQRITVKDMLAGEAHRPMYLVSDRSGLLSGLGGADLGGSDLQENRVI